MKKVLAEMWALFLEESENMNDNIIVDPKLETKYNGKVLFPEKLERARKHFAGRDINAEIQKALEKDKLTHS